MTRRGREGEAEGPAKSRLWHTLSMTMGALFPSPAEKDGARPDPRGGRQGERSFLTKLPLAGTGPVSPWAGA